MKFVRLLLCFLILSASALAQDIGIKWIGLPTNSPYLDGLRQVMQHDYFNALKKKHIVQPNLVLVHCYTPEMNEESTHIVIGTTQDEVWLAGVDVQQLQREVTLMVFLRKRFAGLEAK
jgi:hypothetical protein